MNYNNIFNEVAIYLVNALIVIAFFYFGMYLPTQYNKPKWLNYPRVIGIISVISWLIWVSYGTEIEKANIQYQAGEYGIIVFFILLISSLIGVGFSNKTKEDLAKDEIEKLH